MKIIVKIKCLLLMALLTAGVSSVSAYSLNSYYSALGSITLFDLNGAAAIYGLEGGSYIQFASNGDFNYRFDTSIGVVQGKQTFNVAQFLGGAGDLALNTPAGLNLPNGYVGHGTFSPDFGVTNFIPFTIVASAMPNVFRLGSSDGSFTLWNQQFSSTGASLGFTDFWLTTGGETQVPEPMTFGLLGAGIMGIASRKKKGIALK